MTPLMILEDILKIVKIIHEQVELTQSNQEKLKLLAQMVQRLVRSLKGLGELPNTEHYIEHLNILKNCLQETSEFIVKISKKNKMEQFFFAGKYERIIDEFQKSIAELIPFLLVGLAAEDFINKAKNSEAEARDRDLLIRRQNKFYRRFQEEQRQATRLERLDLERVLRIQGESLEERIIQQLRPTPTPTPDFPEELTANICDLKFDYKIGESDIGALHHGRWREQPVTIKWVERINNEVERAQFIREIKVMSRLHNEHIMPFYGASIEDTRLCLLMGVMERGDLSQTLTSLSLDDRLRMAKDLSLGLNYLHQKNITHGAIKPSNVGVNQYNQAKWMNFGLVKTRAMSLASFAGVYHNNAWQSPESWERGAQLSPSSDVYSFGLLLWTLFTTRMPFESIEPARLIARVSAGYRDEVSTDFPETIKALMTACWQHDARRRPQAFEIVQALQTINIADFSPEQRPASPTAEELYHDATKAQAANHEAEAFQLYERSSTKGHIKAIGTVGLFKLEGKGGASLNVAEGIASLERAAKGRHVRSMMNLARIYKRGDTEDRTPDYPKALHWYQEVLKEEPLNERALQDVALLTSLLESRDSTYLYTSAASHK